MTQLRPLLLAAVLLLSASSCSKFSLYLSLVHTVWDQSSDTQTARICFTDDKHVSIIQHIYADGRTLASNGVYSADGHEVLCYNPNGEGNTVKLIRTFSHLKNTSNKNLTGLPLRAHQTLAGSVWATALDRDLLLAYFPEDGRCLYGRYRNVDTYGGWQFSANSCRQDGYRLYASHGAGAETTAFLYEDVMLVDSLGVLRTSPAVQSEAQNAYARTLWVSRSGQPRLLIFTSAGHFTHLDAAMQNIQGLNRVMYIVTAGTYTASGNELHLQPEDGTPVSCQVASNQLTYQGEAYVPADVRL